METPAPVQAEPKKSNIGLIIGIVVVILLCCCCVLGAGGFYYYRTYSSALSGANPLTAPSTSGSGTSSGSVPGLGTTSNVPGIPSGGKANDGDRAIAWGYVVTAALTDGCSTSPNADSTKISVTQQPDASGVWKEQWTVTCDDKSQKPYAVTFTPGSGGTTDVKVAPGN